VNTRLFPPGGKFLTYYFRNTFSIADPRCFSALVLEYYPSAGLIVYLNGFNILRYNMPAEPTNATTLVSRSLALLGAAQEPWLVSAQRP
jgi:hypothetical protein